MVPQPEFPVKEPADRDRMVGGQGSALKRTDDRAGTGSDLSDGKHSQGGHADKSPATGDDRHLVWNVSLPVTEPPEKPPGSTAPYQRGSSISSPLGPLPRPIRPKAQNMIGLKSRPARLKPESRNAPWQRKFEL